MSNPDSQTPSYISVSTPSASIPDTYPWSDKDRSLILAHKAYHYDMLMFCESLDRNGPSGQVKPKKPNGDLNNLLEGSRKKVSILHGLELHQYLVDKITYLGDMSCPTVEGQTNPNLTSVLSNLKLGYDVVKRQDSLSMAIYIEFGGWLNLAFTLFEAERRRGTITISWKEWLGENVGIADSYARKLREIAKILGPYPKFKLLGINFSEIYQRRKEIEIILLDVNVSTFWKG